MLCQIPLSKVAFSPGKIIHTNEFYKRSSTEKNNIACEEFKMEIRSYYDVAEELTKSIQLLKKEIESKKSIKSSNSYESFVQQQRSFLSNISKPTEIYQLANQQESLNEHKEEKYNSEIDNESSFGAVEIRETYDQDGNVIDSQVVNLSNEFNSTKSMLSEMKTSISSSENNKIEEMSQKLQERLNLPTDQSEAPPLDVRCSSFLLFPSSYSSPLLIFRLKVNLFVN